MAAVPPHVFLYKTTVSLKERRKQTAQVLKENPDCVPIVCEGRRGDACEKLVARLVVPTGATLGGVGQAVKESLQTNRQVVLHINGRAMRPENEVSSLYNVFRDREDDTLYMEVSTRPKPFPLAEVLLGAGVAAAMGFFWYRSATKNSE